MDDAAALFEAFADVGDDVATGLARYVEIRRPIRDAFGAAAEKSFCWYENLREVMCGPVMDFTYGFLTRTGRVDDQRLKVYAPAFYQDYQRYRARKGEAVRQLGA
jgi:hypothetical protein